MTELKRQIQLRWDELLLFLVLETVFFLFGEILIWIMTKSGGGDELFDIGTLVSMLTTGTCLTFIGASTLPFCFNTGISMGTTRRQLVPVHYLITFLESTAALLYAYLLHQLELWILRTFYAGYDITSATDSFFQLKYILPVILAVVGMHALLGTLFLKYGKTAIAVVWVLCFLAFTAVPRIRSSLSRYQHTAWGKTLWNFVHNITESGLIICICTCSIIFLLISWLMLRRQQVKI